ncbi:hypothetical protein Sarmat_00553 [Rickettsiales endosymbiont of Paramecium tredecaurelia]|nr:hypothetical protein [Candidatus Sarmatiella mevalonica]
MRYYKSGILSVTTFPEPTLKQARWPLASIIIFAESGLSSQGNISPCATAQLQLQVRMVTQIHLTRNTSYLDSTAKPNSS